WAIVSISPDTDAAQTARLLLRGASPAVLAAEPDYLRWVGSTSPNDPLFGMQLHHTNSGQWGAGTRADPATRGQPGTDLGTPAAWPAAASAEPVIVAHIDSGADWQHPDLLPALWTNSGETPGNLTDDDGNGF